MSPRRLNRRPVSPDPLILRPVQLRHSNRTGAFRHLLIRREQTTPRVLVALVFAKEVGEEGDEAVQAVADSALGMLTLVVVGLPCLTVASKLRKREPGT